MFTSGGVPTRGWPRGGIPMPIVFLPCCPLPRCLLSVPPHGTLTKKNRKTNPPLRLHNAAAAASKYGYSRTFTPPTPFSSARWFMDPPGLRPAGPRHRRTSGQRHGIGYAPRFRRVDVICNDRLDRRRRGGVDRWFPGRAAGLLPCPAVPGRPAPRPRAAGRRCIAP